MSRQSGVLDFALIVVGGGSAGFAAALRGAELGARTGLIEASTLGGTCVNVGCVPSKTLIRAAEANHRREHHGFEGIAATNGIVQWPAVREQKDALVAQLRQAKYQDVLDAHTQVTLIPERAQLVPGEPAVRAGDRTLRAAKIILATGASPWNAPIPGLSSAPVLDSASAMDLERLPESMIVIGGSAVGLELAQMFARLGVRVTVVEALARLLPAEDPAVGDAVAEYLRREGIGVRAGVKVHDVAHNDGRAIVRLDNGTTIETLVADRLLLATGRRANTRQLGLGAAGVDVGPRGDIRVDAYLRTSASDIYAAGDVTGEPMFVYVAAYAGATAAENALNGDVAPYDLTALPRVTFTDPAVAAVGVTDGQARAAGIEPSTAVLPLGHVPRALAARDTRGFVKLIADRESRRLIGAHVVAAEAGEMITEPALAIRHGLTIDDLASSFHPYLTLSEGIKLAAQAFDRDVRKLSCCAA